MQSIFKNLAATDDSIAGEYSIMEAELIMYYKLNVNKVVERHLFNSMKYE